MVKAFTKKKPRMNETALHRNSTMIQSRKRWRDHKEYWLEKVPAKGQERK